MPQSQTTDQHSESLEKKYTEHRQQTDNENKVTRPLFFSKMIAKLKHWPLRITPQHKNLHTMGATTKNKTITTESPPQNGTGDKDLMA